MALFAWQNNKAILFLLHPKLCLGDWKQCWATKARFKSLVTFWIYQDQGKGLCPSNSDSGYSESLQKQPSLYQIPIISLVDPAPTKLMSSCCIPCPNVILSGSEKFEFSSVPKLLLPKLLYFQELPVIFLPVSMWFLLLGINLFSFPGNSSWVISMKFISPISIYLLLSL